jgi:hypothetical protein
VLHILAILRLGIRERGKLPVVVVGVADCTRVVLAAVCATAWGDKEAAKEEIVNSVIHSRGTGRVVFAFKGRPPRLATSITL